MYYHVEADNIVDENFNFTFRQQVGQRYCPVWRAKNRVNDLVYGYSGIKLFPTQKY